MSSRTCDSCGEKKNLEGGKTCETGHFVCKECVCKPAGIFSSAMKYCPLCKKTLR